MQTGFSVMDAMTTKPVIISDSKTIVECAKLMKKEDVGSIIVLEKKQEKILGIITEEDIVHKIVALKKNPDKIKIADCMTKKIVTISPNNDIYDALVVMRDKNIKTLPVVKQGKLKGVVTIKDILKIEPDLFDIIHEKMEIREQERKPIFGHMPTGYLRD